MSMFIPNVVQINDITNEQNCVVTFVQNHNFTLNELVTINITQPYGMVEANRKRGKVINLTDNTVTLNIDTTNFTPFVIPADLKKTTPPCATPAGSGVDNSVYVPTMILKDCFDNEPI